MKCSKCRAENLAESSFCAECGAKIEMTCTACGAGHPPGAKFCRKCGERIGASERPSAPRISFEPHSYTPKHLAEKILTSRSALEDERKQVTVLFADVKGSMDLAEQVDPEEWHKIMGRFFAILSEGGRARRKFGGNSGLVGEGRDDEVSGRDGSAHLVVQA